MVSKTGILLTGIGTVVMFYTLDWIIGVAMVLLGLYLIYRDIGREEMNR